MSGGGKSRARRSKRVTDEARADRRERQASVLYRELLAERQRSGLARAAYAEVSVRLAMELGDLERDEAEALVVKRLDALTREQR